MTFIGTAAWSIQKSSADRFASEGSSLSRYAGVFEGVEINSSFYKRHRPDTWQRWADSVPDRFRFAVKMPRAITHELKLAETDAALNTFARDLEPLGKKLGPVLIQLPPNLPFEKTVASEFLQQVCSAFTGTVVIEPRHRSWGTDESTSLLAEQQITRVTADPEMVAMEETPGGFVYLRLHGSPNIYYSQYTADELEGFARRLAAASPESWCIFDNTASGAALVNALEMLDHMRRK